MKIGIAIPGVVVAFLIILLGALGLDDFALRRQLAREHGKAQAEIARGKSELDGKMQSTSSQLATARAEVARLNNELAFPIHITQKKAAAGRYLVQIFNSSSETVPVSVTYSNTFARKGRSFEFELSPGFSRDIGRLDGWTASNGDLLQLSCPGFQPIKRVMQ
jgi:hypothetical protein